MRPGDDDGWIGDVDVVDVVGDDDVFDVVCDDDGLVMMVLDGLIDCV